MKPTNRIIVKLVEQNLKQFALEHKKRFKPVPPYPYNEIEIRERFYEKAKEEAEKVIEQERKNVVEARKNHMRNTLSLVIRQARLLVFTEHGKGKIIRKKCR